MLIIWWKEFRYFEYPLSCVIVTDDIVFVEWSSIFLAVFSVNSKYSPLMKANSRSSIRERQTGGSGQEARILQICRFNGAKHNGSARSQAVHLNSFSWRG